MASQLLHTLAKLSGSFALGGLAATCTSYSEDSWPARAAAATLLPGRAHAAVSFGWKRSAIDVPPRVPEVTTFFWVDGDGHLQKVYPVELKVKKVAFNFGRYSLMTACLRGFAITYVTLVDKYFKELRALEDQAAERGDEVAWEDLPAFDWEEAKAKLPFFLLSVGREVVTGCVRTLITQWVVEHLNPRLGWKLIKDQLPAIRAKAKFPFYQRPVLVARTVLRGAMVQCVADMLVAAAIEVIKFATLKKQPWQRKYKQLLRRLVMIPLRSLVVTVASAAAAGIVAIVWPGVPCTLASLAASFAVDSFVCLPAVHDYEERRIVSQQTILILVSSAGVLVLCFAEFLPYPTHLYRQQPKLAIS